MGIQTASYTVEEQRWVKGGELNLEASPDDGHWVKLVRRGGKEREGREGSKVDFSSWRWRYPLTLTDSEH